MCRNIRPLNNFEPPATSREVHDAALQFVRKVSGTTKPSAANQEAFDQAVHEIAHITAAPARRPGDHRAAEEPRGRGREGAGPGARPLRQLTLVEPADLSLETPRDRRTRAAAGTAARRAHRRRAVDRLRASPTTAGRARRRGSR